MRRSQRLIAAAVLIALSGALGGCSSSLSNWDPSDMLDFLDTKKKLPGDRKPVFPEGVPGLEQGVPKDLYKGAQQQQVQDPNAQAAAVPPPPEPSKGKRAAKGRPAPATASTAPPADSDAAPSEEGAPAAVTDGTEERAERGGGSGMGVSVSVMSPPPEDEENATGLHAYAMREDVAATSAHLQNTEGLDIDGRDEYVSWPPFFFATR